MPLLIDHPDHGSSQTDQLLSMVDLAPTLLDLAGLPDRDGLDGISFADSIGRTGHEIRDHVTAETVLWNRDSENAHGEYVDPAGFTAGRDTINLSVRDRAYRYIYRSDDRDELFDQVDDSAEVSNLADQQPDLVNRYRQVLADEVRDVFPEVAHVLSGR